MSNETNPMYLNLEVGIEPDAPMAGKFSFMEVDCIMQLDPETKAISMVRAKKDGTPGAVLAEGTLVKIEAENLAEGYPDYKGSLRTKKGSWFTLAAWVKASKFGPEKYVRMEVQPRVARNGRCLGD